MYNIESVNELIMYLRKSRSDDPAMSVEEVLSRHERQLQEYSETNYGAPVPESRIYREVVSGETIADRPVMREVMRQLESGSIRGVLVIEPQRLSRGDLEDCGRIINTFRYTSTLVVTPPKTYDLSDEYDRKFFEMELTRGNDYLEYTKKILNRGRTASVKQGNFIGSVAPYGYRKIKTGSGKDTSHTLEIVPEEADAIRLMYHLFIDEGYGFTRIARHLDSLCIRPRKSEHWSPAAIKDMLENPVYIGKIRWNWRKTQKVMVDGEITKTRPKTKDEAQWIYVDGKHPAIIDEDTYQAALERRGKNPRIKRGNVLANPFAGLLYCGTCGRAMSYKTFKQSRGKSDNICESMLCNNQAICHTKSVMFATFVSNVIESLEDSVTDFEIKLAQDDGNAARLQKNIVQTLRLELTKLHEKDLRQKDAFDDGIYTKDEYLARNAKVQEQIRETSAALNQALDELPKEIDYRDKIIRLTDCINALKNPDVSAKEKNILLKSCVERITYYNNMESKAGIGRFVKNEFRLQIVLKI